MTATTTSLLDRPATVAAQVDVLVPISVALSVDDAAAVLAWFTVKYRQQPRESATADDLRAELAALLRAHGGMDAVREAVRGLAEDADPGDLADTAWWRAAVARHLVDTVRPASAGVR